MRNEMLFTVMRSASALALTLVVAACSGSDAPSSEGTPAGSTGTSAGSGGTAQQASGGNGAVGGGAAGNSNQGGGAGPGAAGGVGAGGSGVSGGPTSGGSTGSAGSAGSGGATSNGGTTSNGGATANGGTTESGGAAGSGGAVSYPPGTTALFPVPGATGVCVDAPLSMTFSSAPTVGSAGKISIFAKSAPTTAVDTVDIAAATFTDTIGGQARNAVRPVFVDGKQAVIYFHQHKLAANTAYFVTVSSGTFVDGSKAPIGTVSSNTAWSFTTGPAGAASAAMTVDRSGSGGFCTVQGALDAVPSNNTAARTITIAAGNYHEMLYISGKKNLTLHGADRAGTVLEYPNNNTLNAGTSARPLFVARSADGLHVENLTIYNTTPQGGSQAEALDVDGDQVILRDSNFESLQDTLLLAGRVYIVTSFVSGNVDFVWGGGVAYFDRCEIKTVGRAGAIVQSRNGQGAYGYVFVDSKLTSDAGITGQVLARIDATVYPYSHVAYINCQMSSAIVASGWTITPAGTNQITNLRFWEYQSTDLNGAALDMSKRVAGSTRISAAQATSMRDKSTVFGGWNPQ